MTLLAPFWHINRRLQIRITIIQPFNWRFANFWRSGGAILGSRYVDHIVNECIVFGVRVYFPHHLLTYMLAFFLILEQIFRENFSLFWKDHLWNFHRLQKVSFISISLYIIAFYLLKLFILIHSELLFILSYFFDYLVIQGLSHKLRSQYTPLFWSKWLRLHLWTHRDRMV